MTFDSSSLEECDVFYPEHMLFHLRDFYVVGRVQCLLLFNGEVNSIFAFVAIVVVIVIFVDAVDVRHLQ